MSDKELTLEFNEKFKKDEGDTFTLGNKIVMSNEEKQIRENISKEIEQELISSMENCVCLGRDAYGDYIKKCVVSIQNKIIKGK